MPLTLVSHYGTKPVHFVNWITSLQEHLRARLGSSFEPYTVAQVHATLVGLEAVRQPGGWRNENYLRYRNEERVPDIEALLDWLRSPAFEPVNVRLGGFDAQTDHGFLSQGHSPFERSFLVREGAAVTMGWPVDEVGRHTNALDEIRRHAQRFGLLHKWHRRPEDVDNDFFFVLGHVAGIPEDQRETLERELRERLAQAPPLDLMVTRETLSLVAYEDARLPVKSSGLYRLTDARLSGAFLESLH